MHKNRVKLGVAATRRNIFSREDAIKHKNIILKTICDIGIDYVDIEWLNDDGLLYDASFVDSVAEKFKQEKVDALFIPHCNFGCEEAVCKLAKKMDVPVLLWGPRDETPEPDGLRLRDSQCGLFATSKVLQRMCIPFTYIENCWVTDIKWQDELIKFIRVVSVVKSFRNMKIGQIGTRPGDFWSVMCNESELLEKFNIETVPYTLAELADNMNLKLKDKVKLEPVVEYINLNFSFDFTDEVIYKIAAMKETIYEWAQKNELSAVAIQCWNAMQDITGIMPCAVNAMLADEGLPVVCETDICGAISAVLASAAFEFKEPVFFADLTVRHPTNDNAELLWHCGSFPASLKRGDVSANLSHHYTLPTECPGACEWELKQGEVTIVRFDSVGGRYSLLAAKGQGVDGPKCRGTYLWTEFKDWASLEKKFIYGPYIHHVAGIYGDAVPILEEALRYMSGVANDIYNG